MPPLRFLAGLLLTIACAPQGVDRAGVIDPVSEDARIAPASADGPGAPPGRDGPPRREGGVDAVDARIDRAPRVDAPSPDRPPAQPEVNAIADGPTEAAAEAPAARIALLVVGVPGTLSGGDNRLRTALLGRGLTVRVVDDNAAVNVTGVSLVVLSGSCSSNTLATKYRDVMVPLLSSEAAVYDTMGMTGAPGAGLGRSVGGSLTILMPGHPMAAGLQGTIAVVGASSNLGWGRPAPAAEPVAAIPGSVDQVAIFGYPKGAMMATVVAADRRVGFFATDDAAPNLGAAGLRLLSAAIDWALLP